MPLNDMTVKASVHLHRTLYVYLVAHFQQTEIATLERLLHCRDSVCAVGYAHHRQSYSAVGHALICFEFVGE